MNDNTAPVATQEPDWHTAPDLNEKWKFRFGFFEKYGVAGVQATPEARAAVKQMSFGNRIKINVNFYAFFFGCIYFAFFLKLWRQALILIAIALVYAIITVILNVPDGADRAFGLVYSLFCATRANWLYYLKRTQGDIGWKI